jgi:hypothetical protein
MRPSAARFITIIAESGFRYRHSFLAGRAARISVLHSVEKINM